MKPSSSSAESSHPASVSIIVTNYNYGHYLQACLDSLHAQTSAPDEIIVVNDGSTDGSADILASQRRVTVIDQPNGGQAAAFNAGFAASCGEIVMFVDADDKLDPQAIEVVRRLWSDDISALSYGLRMIDGQGRGIGQYAMDLPDSDLLGRMLSHLAIPFMPTSGNAFRRDAIGWAFPLPTERWRISADALLVRVAVMAAPIRQIRQTLGAYRVHGQNNYFRSGTSGPWRANRGLRDIAQAGLDLIALSDRAKRELPRAHRSKLLFAATRSQMKAENLVFDAQALIRFRKKALTLARGARISASLWAYLTCARYSPTIRKWGIDPRYQPRIVGLVLDVFRGRGLTRDLNEPVAVRAPFATRLTPGVAPPQDPLEWLKGPEWSRDHSTGGADLSADVGRFTLARAWSGPARLSLEIGPLPGPPLDVAVFHNGMPLGSDEVKSSATLEFLLPEASSMPPPPDEIELRIRDRISARFGPLSRAWHRAHRLQIHRIGLKPEPAEPPSAVVPVTGSAQMSGLGDVVQKRNGQVLLGERLIGSGESLSIAIPPLKPPFCLQLNFAPDQVPGALTFGLNGTLYHAEIGPSGQCLIEIPQTLDVFHSPAVIRFDLQPTEFLDDPVVALQSLSWLPEGPIGRYGLPALVPGGWAGPGAGQALLPFLSDGWQHDPDGTALMLGSAARLVLSQAAVGADAVLRLDLEPLDPLALRDRLVLVISADGTPRTTVQLTGPGVVDVDLGELLAGPHHRIEIDIIAATRPPNDQEDEVAGDHGGLRLNRIGLAAGTAQVDETAKSVQALPDMHLARVLTQLRKALRQGADSGTLATLRDELLKAISALSPSAAFGGLTADDLDTLVQFSAKLPFRRQDFKSLDGTDWLRDLAQRILQGPGFVTLRGVKLTSLPELTPDFAQVLGRYLVADPVAGTSKLDLQTYQEHLVSVLAQARAAIASSPEDSPLGHLADHIITSFEARQLLFSDLPLRPHVQGFAHALEAKLLRAGFDLFAPQASHCGARRGPLKIGVILHDTKPSPETWIWRALLRKLPADRAEVTMFLTEQNAAPASGFEGCKIVGLAGHSLSATVAAIRRAQMDVIILGANFYGHCFMAEVCAHRLAPRQIALSAAFPATTGFASVDSFVLGKSVAPSRASKDYSESVLWAPGAGQAFDIPPAPDVDDQSKQLTRRRVGVEDGSVMLVSGAMSDKIGAEVLQVWTQALAAVPDAVLVLYPFAESWQQTYDTSAFNARVSEACRASDIDPQRIRILPPIPNIEVKQVLAAADLYLDSFPYSGATTTVEALQCNLPVVAMKGTTQRGQQAAGWLSEFGLDDLIATSRRAYVEIVAGIASDPARLSAVRDWIAENRDAAMAQHEFAKWFEDLLLPRHQTGSEPRYLFHHMPKTGGTSLKRVFGSWFDMVEDYRAPWAYIMPPKLDLDTLGPNAMLCGHFAADWAPLLERYPQTAEPVRWRKITFLRDPLERAISIHAYEKKLRLEYDQTYEPLPLGEYLRSNEGIFLTHFECNESDWQKALDSYWFIGTLERMPECLNYLAAALGKSAPDLLPHDNASPRTEKVTDEDIAIFRANNAIEFEIYDAVAARLDVLLTEHSGD
ncbi:glycosyltransferase [uncultured Ruegeria sp.]|uniref:glycosyltransferase n=1 Tax=uncultured Ruegeria sp. TaxID=259304 RepID=UPI0026110F27|nr:glycosyltransferase [uncultured Ruegeria sp.]